MASVPQSVNSASNRNRTLSDEFLRGLSSRIGAEWLMLCVSLGLTEAERDHIEYDRGYDAKTKNMKALLLWRSKIRDLSVHDQLTTLIDSLQKNERRDLAEYVAEYLEEPKLSDVATVQSEGMEYRVKQLQSLLYDLHLEETKNIPVSPFFKKGVLPIEELYVPVIIREDLEYSNKVRHLLRQRKVVDLKRRLYNPRDLFWIEGKMTRNVYMRGEAARGKSLFCRKLLKDWCSGIKHVDSSADIGEWEKELRSFPFLFFISLRHVDPSQTSVIDMICWSIFGRKPTCHETIHHVISSTEYRCLVVIDGLDEWRFSQEAKTKLRHEGLPISDNMENSTIFWTSRHLAFDEVIDSVHSKDRVVDIEGLDEVGQQQAIDNILINYYDLERNSVEYSTSLSEVTHKLKNLSCQSIIQVPLLTFACVQICYEEKSVGKGMTSMYTALINMLIGRALKKKDIDQDSPQLFTEHLGKYQTLTERIKGNQHVKDFIPLLGRLGEIAYHDLISNETHLVFQRRELQNKLGKSYLDIALKIGLLSQSAAPGACYEDNVSLNFFHKSIQEFIAAVFIASEDGMGESFCKRLSSIKIITEVENVTIFLSGLHPYIGCMATEYILRASDEDSDIQNYRETFYDKHNDLVTRLFKLQLNCYRDIRQTQKNTNTSQVLRCCVSDILLNSDSDTDDILNTAHMLSHYQGKVRSLSLLEIRNDIKSGITDKSLTKFLKHTDTLQSLNIDSFNIPRTLSKISRKFSSMTSIALYGVKLTSAALFSLQTYLSSNDVLRTFGLVDIDYGDSSSVGEGRQPARLCEIIKTSPSLKRLSVLYIQVIDQEDKRVFLEVLDKLSHLKCIDYYGIYNENEMEPEKHEKGKYDSRVVKKITKWSNLQRLVLFYLNLSDSSLVISPTMVQLEDIYLFNVNISPDGWRQFVHSLTTVNHRLEIRLIATNITEECRASIESDKRFTIDRDNIDTDGDPRFDFTSSMHI